MPVVRAVTDLLPFIVVGVSAGSLYGLAGMGLTLTFKTSGVFNFAHDAIAAAATFVFYVLHTQHGVPWPLALVASVGGIGVVAGLVLERLSRVLVGYGPTTAIVGTVGLLLAIQGLLYLIFGFSTRPFADYVDGTAVHVGTVGVTWQQVLAVLVAASAAGGLYAFFRVTRLGAQMRAVVDDPDLLDLTGADPVRVRTLAWIIGCTFASLSGVLIAPFLGLDVALLSLLVVQAFGAVALGRFSSLPGTYLGGVGLGVAASVLTKYVATQPSLGGLPSSLPFLALFIALINWPPKEAAGRGATLERVVAVGRAKAVPRAIALPAAIVGAALLIAVPSLVGARLPVFTHGLTFVILFLSLALLVRTSGQISLCHAAFAAFGATSFAHLSTGAGLPWFPALLLAGFAVVPIGAIVALPAIRLSGVYLALATFGFGLLMERVVYGSGLMFGELGYRRAPRPFFAHSETSFYFLVLAIAACATALVMLIIRTRLGRLLRGLGESPIALTTNGLGVSVTRVIVFSISAFLAGIAGALFASAGGNVGVRGFGAFDSLLFLVVLLAVGREVVSSSIVAAIAVAVAPAYLPDWFLEQQSLIFGLSAIAAVSLAGLHVRDARAAERVASSPVKARVRERTVTPAMVAP